MLLHEHIARLTVSINYSSFRTMVEFNFKMATVKYIFDRSVPSYHLKHLWLIICVQGQEIL